MRTTEWDSHGSGGLEGHVGESGERMPVSDDHVERGLEVRFVVAGEHTPSKSRFQLSGAHPPVEHLSVSTH